MNTSWSAQARSFGTVKHPEPPEPSTDGYTIVVLPGPQSYVEGCLTPGASGLISAVEARSIAGSAVGDPRQDIPPRISAGTAHESVSDGRALRRQDRVPCPTGSHGHQVSPISRQPDEPHSPLSDACVTTAPTLNSWTFRATTHAGQRHHQWRPGSSPQSRRSSFGRQNRRIPYLQWD